MRYWHVTVNEGVRELYTCDIACGVISDLRVQKLMQMLFAKHFLSADEIVAAHRKARTHGANKLLHVRSSHCNGLPVFEVGGDHYYVTAHVVVVD